jgi:hypothetical protein
MDDEGYDDSGTEAGVVVGGSGRGHGGFATGMVFIVLAIGLNFVLDSFSAEDVEELPWFIALAFESGGKLGVTVVLCSIGVLFILWELMFKMDAKEDPKASFSAAARVGATRLMARPAANPAGEPKPGEELFAEEIPDGEEPGPKKIPALKGGFSAGQATGGPVGDTNPGPTPPGGGGGAVVLTTAKYLNQGNGGAAGGGGSGTGGGFRRGRTNHTRTEE